MATSLPSTSRWMWPWSGRMWVLVCGTILAPFRPRWRVRSSPLTVWPLCGATMVSFAVDLGRCKVALEVGGGDGLLVPSGGEEGEVDGVGARLARVDVGLQGAPGRQGDGVQVGLAGRPRHGHPRLGAAGLQVQRDGVGRAGPLDQADDHPAALD